MDARVGKASCCSAIRLSNDCLRMVGLGCECSMNFGDLWMCDVEGIVGIILNMCCVCLMRCFR